jgi:hypothetical protein
VETLIDAGKNMYETVDKNQAKISSCPHSNFTEQLAGVFEKQPFKKD